MQGSYRISFQKLNNFSINDQEFIYIKKGFDLNNQTLSDSKDSTLFYHRLTETFKHAFAHRSLLGDNKNNSNIKKVFLLEN
jgi:hypothetical protein